MKRAPCIIRNDSPDPERVEALCGRPRRYMEQAPLTVVSWYFKADSAGVPTCHECLSVMRNAVEESERRNSERGRA